MKKFGLLFFTVLFIVCIAAQAFAVSSVNNNFTLLYTDGSVIGGTNDVVFTWDETMKTSVAVSGQISNANLSSSTLFYDAPWSAHDVAIYGPGTYTVYTDCPAGSPGCGAGTPITFTVGAGQLGVHLLFDWAGDIRPDMDVVDIWVPNTAFGPSPMCTGPDTCYGSGGSNPAATVWSLMSSDWNGDGINGSPIVDGPFVGFSANFNLNVVGTPNNNFTMIDLYGGITGGTNDVVFTWNGTKKTSVAVSGQVSNATLSSPTTFYGVNWLAHDVAIYGPGTYTVYSACPPGSPGCGVGTPITFTVGTQQLGVHLLWDWGGNNNIDVVDVWVPKAVFAPSPMCTDPNSCGYSGSSGANPATTIWDWMSSDWNGDGINGYPMVMDSPFVGFSANFNVMEKVCGCISSDDCNDGNACTMDMCENCFCKHEPINCNDNNACTTDSCDMAAGCVHTPIVCIGDPCTLASCDPATGCVFTPVTCNDNNACTTDTCDPATGCKYTAIDCNDNNACTTDTCDPAAGCFHTPISNCNTVGIITTVAGNGTYGYSGDNGPALFASFYHPSDVVVDTLGNIYISDQGNHRVRKVDTSGIITTVAGNGIEGYSGDNGPATSASLDYPLGLAIDLSGNLYIADSYNERVRKVDASGTITTVAGNGTAGSSGDNGSALAASLNYPQSVAVDTSGNIYIAEWYGNRIRKVDTSGIITTVAGNGTAGFSGDNGPATSANLSSPRSVKVDSSGNIYFGDEGNYRVRKVDTSGIITTVAGNGIQAYSGDNGPATSASIYWTTAIALDSSGNIYIDDDGVSNVRKVDVSGIITTVAGNGIAGYSGDNGPATSASLYWPSDVAVDISGNLFIADVMNNRVRKVTWSVSTCSGQPNGTPCTDNNVCTFNDVCSNGICKGTAVVCNDNNPCTKDTCNTATGACVYTNLPSGRACDDGNYCTVSDKCDGKGVCKGTAGNNGKTCDDGNACTTADKCSNGVCKGTAKVCNDNNACTANSCNTATGCVYTPIVCNDNNTCTTDTCNTATGCVYTPKNCNDNNACTTDTCNKATGACVNTPIVCNDNNACTTDSCNTATGCVYTLKNCNDNNACTTDSCNTATGACVYTPKTCPKGKTCNLTTGLCS